MSFHLEHVLTFVYFWLLLGLLVQVVRIAHKPRSYSSLNLSLNNASLVFDSIIFFSMSYILVVLMMAIFYFLDTLISDTLSRHVWSRITLLKIFLRQLLNMLLLPLKYHTATSFVLECIA